MYKVPKKMALNYYLQMFSKKAVKDKKTFTVWEFKYLSTGQALEVAELSLCSIRAGLRSNRWCHLSL